jgi:hypothetical protein
MPMRSECTEHPYELVSTIVVTVEADSLSM